VRTTCKSTCAMLTLFETYGDTWSTTRREDIVGTDCAIDWAATVASYVDSGRLC
jgi:hypothetical protein